MGVLKIETDFIDFYDKLSDEKSSLIYKRYASKCRQRGVALNYLRSIGVKTIDVRPVNMYIPADGYIVVYTDPFGHNSTGKKVMTVTEAQRMYGNCVASRYITSEDPLTLKYLQIGKRRFTIYYRKTDLLSINPGNIIDIREISSEYNRLIALPIYSIDYIPDNNEMRATDFNEVQQISKLGLENYITAESIIEEIKDSMLIYNKA